MWLSEFRMVRSIIARLAKGIAERRSTARGPFGRIVGPKDFCRIGQFRLLLGPTQRRRTFPAMNADRPCINENLERYKLALDPDYSAVLATSRGR
jgi:hypothetical protein